jgi:hypothetical protein
VPGFSGSSCSKAAELDDESPGVESPEDTGGGGCAGQLLLFSQGERAMTTASISPYVSEHEHLPAKVEAEARAWADSWGAEEWSAGGHAEQLHEALTAAGCTEIRWYDGLVCWLTAAGDAGHLQLTRTATHGDEPEPGFRYADYTAPHGTLYLETTDRAEADRELDEYLECDSVEMGTYCYTHNPFPAS